MLDDEIGQPSRSLEEYWAIARRRRWYILLPVFICWGLAWTGSWLVPSTFQSEALILVEQQKVPEQYVVPNVTVNLQDRLQSMTQQILSRTRLQSTINRFHLYETRRRIFSQSEDAVEQMRKDITIQLVDARRPGSSPHHQNSISATRPTEQVNTSSLRLLSESVTPTSPVQQLFSKANLRMRERNLKNKRQRSENSRPVISETYRAK